MPLDRRDLRRRLFNVAADQGGYFSAAQAKSLGYSYQAQAHHVAAGNWHRVDRGLFRLTEWVPQLHDDLIRWTLWSKGRGVISHETALAAHGIGELESPQIHMTVPVEFSRRNIAVTLHHLSLPAGDVTGDTGFPVTTVLRALVDVAVTGADEDQLARAIQEAAGAGHLTLRQLRTEAEQINLMGALRVERAIQRLVAS